jgi:hypothetical protein
MKFDQPVAALCAHKLPRANTQMEFFDALPYFMLFLCRALQWRLDRSAQQ